MSKFSFPKPLPKKIIKNHYHGVPVMILNEEEEEEAVLHHH